MFYYPFFNPYNRQYPRYRYDYSNRYASSTHAVTEPSPYINDRESSEKENRHLDSSDDNMDFFEIFGLKLYFDDILIICLLFFLYNEGVQDQGLFIALILLLLS